MPVADIHDSPDLAWLLDLLWPNAVAIGSQPGHRYGVVSRRGRPRLVIPLDTRRVAAGVVTRRSNDLSARARLSRRLAGYGLGGGLVQPFLRKRWTSPITADPPGLEEYLATALGVDDVRLAVSVGPPRPNRKPVIEVLQPNGRTLGFAKVGWNGLTRHLVTKEAAVLNNLDRSALTNIVAPQVLNRGTWNDLEVLILSPLNAPVEGNVSRQPSAAEVFQAASVYPHDTHPLRTSPYLGGLRERVAHRGPDDAALLGAVVDRACEPADHDPMQFAGWHGDWTPWNMMATPTELLVWDWERGGGPVPLGLDVIHYHFQSAWLRENTPAPAAFTTALDRSAAVLAGLNVDPGQVMPLGLLYLVELFLRYAENADHGTDQLRRNRHAAIGDTLRGLVISPG